MRSNRTFFISSRLLNLIVALAVVFLQVALLHFYTSSEWDDISSYDVLKIKIGRTFGEMGSDQLAKAPKMRTRRDGGGASQICH
eukprot:scaffold7527_cov104-Skeletonema_dohrnii-CCMP3373.AAC.2